MADETSTVLYNRDDEVVATREAIRDKEAARYFPGTTPVFPMYFL
jgi:hypothetical protein